MLIGVLIGWLKLILAVLGLGLAINCLIGLFSREGRWDAQSSSVMLWSQALGLMIGLGLFVWGFGLLGFLSGGSGTA